MSKIEHVDRSKALVMDHLIPRVDNCVSKYRYKSINLFGYAILFYMCGCVTEIKGNPSQYLNNSIENQDGIFFSGEYGYFKTSNGKFFTLRIPSESDRNRMYGLAPVTVEPQEICLALRVSGEVTDEVDTTGRPVLTVSRISASKKVACPRQR